ncbi:MAG: hypothetical protein GY927_23700 [bacterium]|nr:hypothetical protein [bacterium]
MKSFIEQCGLRGVDIKWFGDLVPRAFTSRHESWRYIEQTDLTRTGRILDCLCDLRLPLTFDEDDCRQIVAVINEAILQVKTDQRSF